ncbi:MAG TPA: alpha/beta hydrolase, partial [Sphingomicrobium sp.]|nr:alpha/beta hydrolase [Sphingomicrobium sp.]
ACGQSGGGGRMFTISIAAAVGVLVPVPCAFKDVPADYEKSHRVECGWVTVPRRHDRPEGKSIRLWTARIKAIGPKISDDPILYINGGPGIATVDEIAPYLDDIKSVALFRQSRDVILFDQRGSGRSEEALCPDLAKTLNAIDGQGLDPAVEDDRSRAAFAKCRADIVQQSGDLDAYTTSATVLDLETLRRAYAVKQWNLLSISYGSLVALHAMRVSPQAIRSVILNSPYPPNSITWAEQASSAAAAYAAIDRLCARQTACRTKFGALVPKLEATLARLERSPLPDGKKVINGRIFAKALWPMTVSSRTVQFVPMAIDRAHKGGSATIRAMVAKYGGGDSFGGYSPAQAIAISCHESGRTAEHYSRARSLYPALVSATPDDGWDKLCATFRPGFADPGFFAPVASTIPTLIYAGSLDPATPMADAYQAMRFLPNATLVEIEGAAHGPMGIDDCTRGIAAAFLADPTARPDRACLSKRDPFVFAIDGLDQLLAPKKP